MADPDLLAKLHRDTRIPPKEFVGKLPRSGIKLDYLGHAAVTDLLLEHDPEWSWEPVAWTEAGLPGVTKDQAGWPVGLWIRLTVHGHTRLGYGTCPPGKDEAIKELIGDALRNAAMRFGVAVSLWAKEEWSDHQVEAGDAGSQTGERTQRKTATSGKEEAGTTPKENVPRSGRTVRRPPDREPVLKKDQALAKQAADLGLDEQTRKDVIKAITKGRTESGKDLEPAEVIWVATAYDELSEGIVELRYDPDGTPRIGKPRPPGGFNPGPPGDEPF